MADATDPPPRRVLLKLSGEALADPARALHISPAIAGAMAGQIAGALDQGVQVGIVVGGGNFWRGASANHEGMERATADYVGMLATMMNALALQAAIEAAGAPSRVMSAIEMREVAEPFIRRRAIRHLERGRAVVFGAGTGSPYFSTDTAAALRANEIGASCMLKGTKVDGVYDSDPMKNPDAQRFEKIAFADALGRRLGVMDGTALSLCMENDLPVRVFALHGSDDAVLRALLGDPVGTLVHP